MVKRVSHVLKSTDRTQANGTVHVKDRHLTIYARVSTKDQGQELENQLHPLRTWAELQNRHDVLEYTDHASGGNLDRKGWKQLTADWRAGLVDTVAVLRLDRAFRSVVDMHNVLSELEARGIRFAVTTTPIDTGTPHGRLLIGLLGHVAEFERDLISIRVKEGIARAKRQGKKIGRKRLRLSTYRAREIVNKHRGDYAAAALELGVSISTVKRRVKNLPS